MPNRVGRPKSDNPMMRTALAMPRELHDALMAEAAALNVGFSTIIRERLQASIKHYRVVGVVAARVIASEIKFEHRGRDA